MMSCFPAQTLASKFSEVSHPANGTSVGVLNGLTKNRLVCGFHMWAGARSSISSSMRQYASRCQKKFQRGGVISSYTLECNNSINLINSASGELPTISHQLWMKLLKLQKGGWREEKTRWQHTSHSTYKAKKVNWLCKIALFLVCVCVLYSAMLLLERRSRPSIIHVW